MTLDALIMLSGTLTALIAISGFPSEWKVPMLFLLGILIVVLGIVARRRGLGVQRVTLEKKPEGTSTDSLLQSPHEES